MHELDVDPEAECLGRLIKPLEHVPVHTLEHYFGFRQVLDKILLYVFLLLNTFSLQELKLQTEWLRWHGCNWLDVSEVVLLQDH